MKPLKVVVLCVAALAVGVGSGWRLAVAFHRPQFEHHGWSRSQFHGTYSIYAYGAANEDLEEKIKQVTDDSDSRAFAIPSIGSYHLYYYIPRRLTDAEDQTMREFATERLGHHDAEYAKAIEKKT